MMKKTIAYIDGYNLYYGLLKGAPHIKWLDIRALVSAMFKEEHELLAVKFFTAHVRTYPHDLMAEERQKIFIFRPLARSAVLKLSKDSIARRTRTRLQSACCRIRTSETSRNILRAHPS